MNAPVYGLAPTPLFTEPDPMVSGAPPGFTRGGDQVFFTDGTGTRSFDLSSPRDMAEMRKRFTQDPSFTLQEESHAQQLVNVLSDQELASFALGLEGSEKPAAVAKQVGLHADPEKAAAFFQAMLEASRTEKPVELTPGVLTQRFIPAALAGEVLAARTGDEVFMAKALADASEQDLATVVLGAAHYSRRFVRGESGTRLEDTTIHERTSHELSSLLKASGNSPIDGVGRRMQVALHHASDVIDADNLTLERTKAVRSPTYPGTPSVERSAIELREKATELRSVREASPSATRQGQVLSLSDPWLGELSFTIGDAKSERELAGLLDHTGTDPEQALGRMRAIAQHVGGDELARLTAHWPGAEPVRSLTTAVLERHDTKQGAAFAAGLLHNSRNEHLRQDPYDEGGSVSRADFSASMAARVLAEHGGDASFVRQLFDGASDEDVARIATAATGVGVWQGSMGAPRVSSEGWELTKIMNVAKRWPDDLKARFAPALDAAGSFLQRAAENLAGRHADERSINGLIEHVNELKTGAEEMRSPAGNVPRDGVPWPRASVSGVAGKIQFFDISNPDEARSAIQRLYGRGEAPQQQDQIPLMAAVVRQLSGSDLAAVGRDLNDQARKDLTSALRDWASSDMERTGKLRDFVEACMKQGRMEEPSNPSGRSHYMAADVVRHATGFEDIGMWSMLAASSGKQDLVRLSAAIIDETATRSGTYRSYEVWPAFRGASHLPIEMREAVAGALLQAAKNMATMRDAPTDYLDVERKVLSTVEQLVTRPESKNYWWGRQASWAQEPQPAK